MTNGLGAITPTLCDEAPPDSVPRLTNARKGRGTQPAQLPFENLRTIALGSDIEKNASLVRVFVNAADTLTDEFDLAESLGSLIVVCEQLVARSEVSVTMADDRGQLRVVASSSQRKRVLEQYQIDHDLGPSIDAYRSGRQTVENLTDSTRDHWERFSELAQVVGYRTFHTVPFTLRSETIGVLSIAEMSHRDPPPLESQLLRALADCAAIGIINRRAYASSNELGRQLQGALTTRILIEQSKGVVSARLGVSVDEAFELLRRYARGTNRKLNEISTSIIEGSLATHDLWAAATGAGNNTPAASA